METQRRQFTIETAERRKARLRIGIGGASGFGKTYSALLIAYGITKDWSKITIIDTENRSADLNSDLGNYRVIPFDAPYPPEAYVDAIKFAEMQQSEVIIIDSITHEWNGEGGCLQIADEVTSTSNNKNSWLSWAKVDPRHNKFIQAILKSPCHIITTVRKKQDYDMIKNQYGKSEIVKLGMKEVTREGFEYELTLNFDIYNDLHYCKASKDRTGLFLTSDGSNEPFRPSIKTGEMLSEWANKGVDYVEYICETLQNVQNRQDLENVWYGNPDYQQNQKVVDKFKEMAIKYPKAKPEIAATPAKTVKRVQLTIESANFKKCANYLVSNPEKSIADLKKAKYDMSKEVESELLQYVLDLKIAKKTEND